MSASTSQPARMAQARQACLRITMLAVTTPAAAIQLSHSRLSGGAAYA